jgi:hypothetical protein
MAQMVQYLPCKGQTQNSHPSTTKKIKKRLCVLNDMKAEIREIVCGKKQNFKKPTGYYVYFKISDILISNGYFL